MESKRGEGELWVEVPAIRRSSSRKSHGHLEAGTHLARKRPGRIVSTPLTEDEMSAIGGLDRNCRLVKGQVFLWKEDQSWEALWDEAGEITPP